MGAMEGTKLEHVLTHLTPHLAQYMLTILVLVNTTEGSPAALYRIPSLTASHSCLCAERAL